MLRRDYGVKRLVCEGGGQLLRSLALEDLLDEIRLTIAPVIFGGSAAPSLTGLPSELLPEPQFFRLSKHTVSDGECALHYVRRRRKD
jgi:riboflavin biosynthesis pyrimidine reductase